MSTGIFFGTKCMHIISCGQVRFTSRQVTLIKKKEKKYEVASNDVTITNTTKIKMGISTVSQ